MQRMHAGSACGSGAWKDNLLYAVIPKRSKKYIQGFLLFIFLLNIF